MKWMKFLYLECMQVDFASKQFSSFANKFNGLYTLFTPIPTLEITDYALIKEAFIDHG